MPIRHPSNNRRFSDIAPNLGIDTGDVYLHDIYGASLRMLDSMNKGAQLRNVNNIIGKRNDGDLEQVLPDDVKQTLIDLISEAVDKIDKIRLRINKTFKINSEVIWLSAVEETERLELSDVLNKINLISPNDFSRVVVYVREKLENEKRRIELNY